MAKLNQASKDVELRNRVLAAAKTAIEERGILGLRVANVAMKSHCSLTSMYRVFGSRETLLAEVLLIIYEVIASIPSSFYDNSDRNHSLRSQVLAVSGTNAALREKLAQSLQNRRRMMKKLLHNIEPRLVEKSVTV